MSSARSPHRGVQRASRSAHPHGQAARPSAGRHQYSAPSRAAVQRGGRWVLLSGGVAAAAVVIAVVVLVVVKLVSPASSSSGRQAAPADVVQALSGIPQSVLNEVGVATPTLRAELEVGPPQKVTTKMSPLTWGGKPEVLYIGEESCPYCAATRWALVAALSRFGHFSNLSVTSSASNDVFPSTPTFSFYGAHYTSPYVSFVAYELATRTGTPLQTPHGTPAKIFGKLDAPPYVPSSQYSYSLPFIDFGNRWVQIGAVYSPGVLHQGASFTNAVTWDQQGGQAGLPLGTIAGSTLYPKTSPSGQAIDAATNILVATICNIDGGKPASVCRAPGTLAGAKLLAEQAAAQAKAAHASTKASRAAAGSASSHAKTKPTASSRGAQAASTKAPSSAISSATKAKRS